MSELKPVFRDEGTAALEKVARLTDENLQLRQEIERLKQEAATPAPPQPLASQRARLLIAAMLATASVTAVSIFLVRSEPDLHPRTTDTHADPLPPPPVVQLPPMKSSASPVSSRTCDPPYTVDPQSGLRRFKAECL